jgi:hypothetical protein
MRYDLQIQKDAITETVRARYAMIIPILRGMLYSAQGDIVNALGGYSKITLEQFARIYIEQPGDYGICFEYAVHQGLRDRDPSIHPLVSEVINTFCGIKGEAESILFGAEKTGATHIMETAKDTLTDDSRVLAGKKGQPAKLKRYLDDLVKAFRSVRHRDLLPQSIRGLWKADLFIGSPQPDQWVATTLKTRRTELEGAPGLRIGLFPEERPGQRPERDDDKNLVLCPLPYSGDFMQLFGASFQIIKQIIGTKGKQPNRAALVYDDDQTVAKWLVDRGSFALVSILDALEPIKQPGLIEEAQLPVENGLMETVAAAPIPMKTT